MTYWPEKMLLDPSNVQEDISPLTPKQEGLNELINITDSLVLCFTLLLATVFIYFINLKIIRHVTPAAITMLIGCFIGIWPTIFPSVNIFQSITNFNKDLFYYGLLPFIIFEVGFSLDQHSFKRNFWAINLFAIVGTLISVIIVGVGLLLCDPNMLGFLGGRDYSVSFILIFSALISSIDPVATFSIFGEYSPKPIGEFFSILSGESILNDAVSIILTRSLSEKFLEHSKDVDLTFLGVFLILTNFIYVMVCSLLVGIAFGALVSLIFRQSRLNKMPEVELFITVVFVYLSYGVAESLGLSGIVALFFNGIVLRHYNYHNLSEKARTSSTYIFKTISFSFEQLIYAMLGFTIIESIASRAWNIPMIAISMGLCLLGRCVHIFPFSYLLNIVRKPTRRITLNQQVMMFISGLRGAVGFTLAISIACPDDGKFEFCKTNRDIVITTTLAIIIITTLFVGSSIEFSATQMQLFDLSSTHDHSTPSLNETSTTFGDEPYGELESPHQSLMENIIEPQERPRNFLRRFYMFLIRIESTYLRVYLGGPRKNNLIY